MPALVRTGLLLTSATAWGTLQLETNTLGAAGWEAWATSFPGLTRFGSASRACTTTPTTLPSGCSQTRGGAQSAGSAAAAAAPPPSARDTVAQVTKQQGSLEAEPDAAQGR